jgi:hypothetical protein
LALHRLRKHHDVGKSDSGAVALPVREHRIRNRLELDLVEVSAARRALGEVRPCLTGKFTN